MQNPWWSILGLLAAFIGAAHLENARRGIFLRPVNLFWSAIAGYLAYKNVNLYDSGGTAQLTWYGLVFCAASPFLGYLYWGRDGEIRRNLYRAVLFLFLTAISLLAWTTFLGISSKSVALGILTGAVPFFPARRVWNRVARPFRAWNQRRNDRRTEARAEAAEQDERALSQLERLKKLHASTERKLRAKDRRIDRLKRRDKQHEERLKLQRSEIVRQVKRIRETEVKRVQKGEDGLRFDPQLGFLMAEAGRVLRAQIASGDRVPAVENDTFFHQVVVELLEPDDFGKRYLHRKGRQAIAAVNRFLAGKQPLSSVHARVQRLRLKPELLAPYPLEGKLVSTLLEAWLVPHRRHQDRLREEFLQGRHRLQVQITEFLRKRLPGLPSQEQWRELSDEHPKMFYQRVQPTRSQRAVKRPAKKPTNRPTNKPAKKSEPPETAKAKQSVFND